MSFCDRYGWLGLLTYLMCFHFLMVPINVETLGTHSMGMAREFLSLVRGRMGTVDKGKAFSFVSDMTSCKSDCPASASFLRLLSSQTSLSPPPPPVTTALSPMRARGPLVSRDTTINSEPDTPDPFIGSLSNLYPVLALANSACLVNSSSRCSAIQTSLRGHSPVSPYPFESKSKLGPDTEADCAPTTHFTAFPIIWKAILRGNFTALARAASERIYPQIRHITTESPSKSEF
jgi:hypothetical protein